MLQGVMVDYYGNPTPIQQVANVNTQDAKTLVIQPWEKPMLDPIEKAILAANLGVTPMNNGEKIMISLPPLTEERRRDLVKKVKEVAETGKVSLRNARREANDGVKDLVKDGLSEDAGKTAEDDINNLTKKYTDKIEKHVEAKEAEIMTV